MTRRAETGENNRLKRKDKNRYTGEEEREGRREEGGGRRFYRTGEIG